MHELRRGAERRRLAAALGGAVRAPAVEYASSLPVEELGRHAADGGCRVLLFKDRRACAASASRRSSLDPARELDGLRTHARPADGSGAPRLRAASRSDGVAVCSSASTASRSGRRRPRAPGWRRPRWLARLHATRRPAGRAGCCATTTAHLRPLGCRGPCARRVRPARGAVAALGRARRRGWRLRRPTFIHGELYPSNVLVEHGRGARRAPVDWEMAGIGPGVARPRRAHRRRLGAGRRARIARAYRDALPARRSGRGASSTRASRCSSRVQWLGWSPSLDAAGRARARLAGRRAGARRASAARERALLVVNADDFGPSAGVNRGIAARPRATGSSTSTSLMVRWPAAAAAAACARAHPRLGARPARRPRRVGVRGRRVARRYEVVDTDDPAAVARGARPPARRVPRALPAASPTHLDSHQHVHRASRSARSWACARASCGVPLRHHGRVRYCGAFYGQGRAGQPLPERSPPLRSPT